MVEIHAIVLIVIGCLELLLSLYILFQNPKDRIRRWYSLLVFSVALWVLSIGLGITINDVFAIDILTRLNWIGPIVFAPTLLFFSWIFPYTTKKIGIRNWLIFGFSIVTGILLLYNDIIPIYTSINSDPWRTVIFGPGVHIFNVLFLLYWVWSAINLYIKFRSADGVNRWLLRNVLLGILISSIFGVVSNMILPWFGLWADMPYLSAIGPELSIIWLGFTAYVLFKKNI
ncbi:MAG: histidine kinase N-terminal 7TM domain-containing protein [Patescibacteria group bacterium]